MECHHLNIERALEIISALVYNLLRKVIGCDSDLPSVQNVLQELQE